jgi:ferritin-like metal-binding protein YciE
MAKEKHLSELFHDTLKDIYFAEKKILGALPKMAKAAQSKELKAAFEKHESETEQQVTRLEQVFKSIGETPKGKACDAIMGILDEGKEIMDEYKDMPAVDAGLLAAAQAVEHYEIARYGTLKCWASGTWLQRRREASRCDAERREEDRRSFDETRGGRSQHARADGRSGVIKSEVKPRVEDPRL